MAAARRNGVLVFAILQQCPMVVHEAAAMLNVSRTHRNSKQQEQYKLAATATVHLYSSSRRRRTRRRRISRRVGKIEIMQHFRFQVISISHRRPFLSTATVTNAIQWTKNSLIIRFIEKGDGDARLLVWRPIVHHSMHRWLVQILSQHRKHITDVDHKTIFNRRCIDPVAILVQHLKRRDDWVLIHYGKQPVIAVRTTRYLVGIGICIGSRTIFFAN